MPKFTYTARNRSGQSVSDVLDAPSRKDALRLLSARGLQPVTIGESIGAAKVEKRKSKTKELSDSQETGFRLSSTPMKRGGVKLSRGLRLPFLQSLSDLTSSGLSAGEAVRLLGMRLKEPALKALCAALWEQLGEGLPLSRAMQTYPQIFDQSTINLIQAGEATGNLNEVLLRLITHFTEQKEMRQKLLTALAYPAFICPLPFR